ncbi:3-oxoacyl-ACP synthase III [Oceanicoccus sp. KOV_DT_Chl]|uniref:3-oxoacyl-ACP synthase III n=1 Tax=Oceanicoccus sp. KOV_DT_Chl TaxID=1904639 RepID=UPI000C7E1398|nr:3-oxoacyl-ACP synthase III [Oceanicoccus sp. KOV_DT_Chl]
MPSNVVIEAIAYELPPHIITSLSLEEQIAANLEKFGIPLGNLERLTGISERRFWDPGTAPSDVATQAARKVIEESGIDPADIGCIINTSVSKDYIEPSIACLVHGNLGLSPHCRNFDIGNACLGFVDGINNIMMMLEAGQIKYGLVVNGESARDPVEPTIELLQDPNLTMEGFRDNFATLTLGSGAVAMLLTHKDNSNSGHIINGSVSLAATQYNRLCLGQRDSMITQPHELLVAGVELATDAWELCKQTLANWSDESIDIYIPHQVSIPHIKLLGKTLGLSREKIFLNVETMGNIGPAALPITLKMAEEAGRLSAGDHVALLGIGSGLNCTGMSVTW